MKAVETYVMKAGDPDRQAALLLERWQAVRDYIETAFTNVRRITWSCHERRWVYVLFAEIETDSERQSK